MFRSRTALITILVIFLMAASYAFGWFTHFRGLFPTTQVMAVKAIIDERARGKAPPGNRRNVRKTTIHLPRLIDELSIPIERAGSGGGLTSAGDDLVLLTFEGHLFRISGLDYTRAPIEVPDYGLDAYRAAAEGKYDHLSHAFWSFRYNDVLFYSTSESAGLAISYTQWFPERECYGTTVALLRLPAGQSSLAGVSANAGDWEILFQSRPCLPLEDIGRAMDSEMAGGRLAFMAPDKILLASGNYGWDGMFAPKSYEQDTAADYGKIIEIDVNDGSSRHISRGHRNAQGILVDREGDIWSVEHGPRGGDELNLIAEGENYGWPLATLGTRYNMMRIPPAESFGFHDRGRPPVFAWLPSIGIANLAQAEGFDPTWDGDLLVASMKKRTLFRIRVRDGHVRFAEPITFDYRLRYVHQHTDGRIALWTDAGIVLLLRRDSARSTGPGSRPPTMPATAAR